MMASQLGTIFGSTAVLALWCCLVYLLHRGEVAAWFLPLLQFPIPQLVINTDTVPGLPCGHQRCDSIHHLCALWKLWVQQAVLQLLQDQLGAGSACLIYLDVVPYKRAISDEA